MTLNTAPAVLAALSLVGCSAVPAPEPDGPSPIERATTLVETVREVSIEVLATISDDAACRAEWRRLAADATDTIQRSDEIMVGALRGADLDTLWWNGELREAAGDALVGRIAPALDAVKGCVQRGGLTMEEWVELEARSRRQGLNSQPDASDPVQKEALARIGGPVA